MGGGGKASLPSPLGLRHREVDRLRRLIQRRSQRQAEGAFVLEGAKLVSEALDARAAIEALYLAPEAVNAQELAERALGAGARVHSLQAGVLERVARTVSPQPIMAVARWRDVTLPESLPPTDRPALVVVCVDVRDPGNAGTVVRSADAAGASVVVFCAGCVELLNPKTVAATAGSIFHLPVVQGGDPESVLDQLGRSGFRRLACRAAGGNPHSDTDLTGRVALVLGNEAHGLPGRLESFWDGSVRIAMAGRAESLNVGMAAAILCFESMRQRGKGEVA